MEAVIGAFLVSIFASIGGFMGALLAELSRRAPDEPTVRRVLGAILNAAAGAQLAVVGVEVMPRVLEGGGLWFQLMMAVGGGAFAILIDEAFYAWRLRQLERTGEAPSEALATWPDVASLAWSGIMIGAGQTISAGLAFVIALGRCLTDLPERFVTVSEMRLVGVGARRRVRSVCARALAIVAGAVFAAIALGERSETFRLGFLAFTGSILIKNAFEAVVGGADDRDERETAKIALLLGFLAFAALSATSG